MSFSRHQLVPGLLIATLAAAQLAGAFSPQSSFSLKLQLPATALRGTSSCLSQVSMMSATGQKMQELNIVLPERPPAAANYDPYVISGRLIYVSGQIPMMDGEIAYKGKVGGGTSTIPSELTIEQGYQSARLCGLNLVAQVKEACGGDLDRIKRVVKLTGFVNCNPDFTDQPKVINGASDLMNDIFGVAGKHARSAVGTVALPFGVATEVEGIFEMHGSQYESALDGDGFGATFNKRGVALEFIKGMKVEAVDRSFKDIITVATIKEIDGDKVLITFDGWGDKYDYWCAIDDGDFQPPGTTMRANARLSPPNGYVGYFDWGSYLEEENALAAPPSIFTSTKVFPSFKGDVSVRFELWQRIEATVLPTPPSPEQQERDEKRSNK